MAKGRFVTQQRVRLDLSGDDWIEVKKDLAYGDTLTLQTAGLTGITGDALFTGGADGASGAEAKLDMPKWMTSRLMVWILDWSLRDDNDHPVKFTKDAVNNLHPDTAGELHAALDAHIAALENEKKVTAGK